MPARILLTLVLVLGTATFVFVNAGSQDSKTPTLFAQSAQRILQSEGEGKTVSYILLDATTGIVIATNWNDLEKPVPVGSLIKPFTALAYGEPRAFRYPKYFCHGTADGCWRPGGHGEVDIKRAIAQSCNSYFRSLTKMMTSADFRPASAQYGIPVPREQGAGAALAGLGNAWPIAPLDIGRAYLELIRHRQDPGIKDIVDGLRESASIGTGAQVDAALHYTTALVKTGTATCTHAIHAPGDGFVVALAPADQPQVLLLVRVHAVPGASAGRIAGKMLQRIVE